MARLPTQLTPLSTTLPRQGGWSRYASMTSAQAHGHLRRNVDRWASDVTCVNGMNALLQ